MKYKFIFLIFSFIIAETAMLSSCSKDKGIAKTPEPTPTPTPTPTVAPDPCDTVNYAQDIKPIVDAKCLSCHGDVNPFAGFSLNSYDALKDKGTTGKLKARIIDGNPSFMPQGSSTGLPPAQKDLFACWIKNGFRKDP